MKVINGDRSPMKAKQRLARINQRGFDMFLLGHGRPSYVVKCSGCGVSGTVTSESKSELPAELVQKRLGQQGWKIGPNPDLDICPGCQLKNAPPRGLVIKLSGTNVRMPVGIVEAPIYHREIIREAKVAIKAEAPRQMSSDERRLITEKFFEVWLDEKRGYSEGWSDDRVARDLGVPRNWVSIVREPYGADKSEETARFVAECQIALDETKKALAEIRETEARLTKMMDALFERTKKLAA